MSVSNLKPAAALLLILTLSTHSAGQDKAPLIPRDSHPWGSFAPGSWKKVRVVTETIDAKGDVINVSTTENTTTLVSAGENQYCLRMDVSVDVGGKRFSTPTQEIKQGYSGETAGQVVEVKKLGTESVVIAGQKVASEVREITVSGENSSRVSRVYFSPLVSPFVLKRETQLTDGTGKSAGVAEVEVVALEMPTRVLSETHSAAHVKTVQRTATGSVVSFEVCCEDVPGAVVASAYKEIDSKGNVIRRGTMELVDFHAAADSQSQANPSRRQARRSQRR